ncbi:MAG: intracellular septation protein, partial [Alphaproteobacteria bacterium]
MPVTNATDEKNEPGWLKPTVDYVPISAFFIAYLIWGLMPATAALMGATLFALILSLIVVR